MTGSQEQPKPAPRRADPKTASPPDPGAGRRLSHARLSHAMERISTWASRAAGSSAAFILASAIIIAWLITGPLFHYSDTWQLVINTSTTIVTFLMVFLIQRSQNKESSAIQLKLNEIIAALEGASNHLISVEDRSEDEILMLREHYAQLVGLMREDVDISKAHSVEEAINRHRKKLNEIRDKA